jgi:ABC-type lipoprotein release transport system permease subunit
MNYFKIAWRNLWRNKRRTLITVASIFFGVVLATIMNSLQDGTYANMIDMMVKLSSGYIQIQNPEFQQERSINKAFIPSDELMKQLEETSKIIAVAKRLETFALLSSGPNTRGGAVVGFEPSKDKQTSNLQNWISEGTFLSDNDKGILVTSNVAKHLNLSVNDTIILISQGYRGVTAAGKYPIKGILNFSTPQMNNIGVFMGINLAQELFSAEGMVTSLMIMMDSYTDVAGVKDHLNSKINGSLAVLTWQELIPEIVQFIESDMAGGVVMLGILYIVIGFGIFGTIIMMVAERRRELAVMIAVGMQKYKLSAILFIETFLIGLVGVISGFLVSVPIILILIGNPIPLPGEIGDAYLQYGFEPYWFFGAAPLVFLIQVITVFSMTLIISFYPIMKVKNMVVSKAIKGE